MALVEFTLTPLESIQPWGVAPDLRLNWFGLSDGAYHLELGDVRLLEYREKPGWPRYVEYSLARLHEDLLEMMPYVLEALPAHLVGRLPGGSLSAGDLEMCRTYRDTDHRTEDVDSAMEAFGMRRLDSLYLTPGFGVWLWSLENTVVIEWDNRVRKFEGEETWTASVGRYEIDRSAFLDELESFDRRLMSAMDDRIQRVGREWNRPDVKIDIPNLRADHASRATWHSSALKRQAPTTDWQAVERGLLR